MEANVQEFYSWILSNEYPKSKVNVSPTEINIVNEFGYASITFNNLDIIEFIVTNAKTKENEFYLHFQYKTFSHAKKLYKELMDAYNHLSKKVVFKVLLCCTGGLTTSYFAGRVREALKLLKLDYDIQATSYLNLYNEIEKYDLVMLAPQIAYESKRITNLFKDKRVLEIPTKVFATYDVAAMIRIMEKESVLKQNEKISQQNKPIEIKNEMPEHNKIFVLSIIRNSGRIHALYRVYDKNNKIVLDSEIIKYQLDVSDIFDIIDTVLLIEPKVESIGISIPGIIVDGYVDYADVHGLNSTNLLTSARNKYKDRKVIVCNDVNTAAVGYYATQDKYKNICVYFQPINNYGGVGNIIDGRLHRGNKSLAGEVQYMSLNISNHPLVLNKTPEGMVELVSNIITNLSVTLAPELIVVFDSLLSKESLSSLVVNVEKNIPQKYIPEIRIEERLDSYTLPDQLILCAQDQ